MGSSWDYYYEKLAEEREEAKRKHTKEISKKIVKPLNKPIDPGSTDDIETGIEYHLNQVEYHLKKVKDILAST